MSCHHGSHTTKHQLASRSTHITGKLSKFTQCLSDTCVDRVNPNITLLDSLHFNPTPPKSVRRTKLLVIWRRCSQYRHDNGLAGNGWTTHSARYTRREQMEFIRRCVEWGEEGLIRWRTPMGGPNRSYARVDNCLLLDRSIWCWVSGNFPFPKEFTFMFFIFSIFYLYHLIRRPRMILDFALTLVFNHLVLTTYYSASLPYDFPSSYISLRPISFIEHRYSSISSCSEVLH